MNYFNGRFDIEDGGYHDETHYRLFGTVVDNSGTYFAADAQVGDIIYLDGSPIGVPLLRYKIAEVNYDETSGATLSVLVTWDMIEGIDPQEPFGGMEGIIGALHSNGITANCEVEVTKYLKGDVDNDKRISIKDVKLALQYSLSKVELTETRSESSRCE